MEHWQQPNPKNFKELSDFYHNYYKELYSEISIQNILPNETMFEVTAAFDHLTTHWTNGLSEQEVVGEAFGHLKRACLDLFKLKVKEARIQYDKLCSIDTSIIDNGEFDRNLHTLFNEIRIQATEARRLENEAGQGDVSEAFKRWENVSIACNKLQSDFFLSSKFDWAKKKMKKDFYINLFWGFLIGVVTSLIGGVILYIMIPH